MVTSIFLFLTKPRHQQGLTLLELMIVVAIIGVLAAIAIPNYRQYVETTRYVVVMSALSQIDRDAAGFFILNNRYPDSLAEIGYGNLKDPWGNPYQYMNMSTLKGNGKARKFYGTVPVNTDFDLYSMGPDGESKTPFTAKASRDDIVRANNGLFVGRVSDY